MMLAFWIFLLLSGCSYYGTNTFLAPSEKDRKIECSNVVISVGGILTAQDKIAHAFVGIPYFPAILGSSPRELGELIIYFQNIPDGNLCSTTDLYLTSNQSQSVIIPVGVWKSKLGEIDGEKNLGCYYKFGNQLDAKQEHTIRFKNGLLNCSLPDVNLTIIKDSGYHLVLIQ